MKKILLTIIIAPVAYCAIAQTNTFPTSGNVGIGTTAPIQVFDVVGTGGSFSSTAKANAVFEQDHTNYRGILLGYDSSGQIGVIGSSGSSGSLAFWNHNGTNYFEAMRLTSAGYLGIGTTSPQNKLHVYQNTPDATGFVLQGNTINSDGVQHYVGMTFDGDTGNGTGNYSQIRSYSNLYTNWGSQLAFFTTQWASAHNLVERMRIDAFGNVGIGTASPSALLDVESLTVAVTSLAKSGLNAGFSQFQAQNDNGGNAAFHHAMFGSSYSGTMFGVSLANSATLYADGTSISGMLIGTKNATPITIGTNNAAAITVLSGGNVGIGTTNPGSYRLAVNGGIHSQSVNVDLTGWSDYVFKKEYRLPSLAEVKAYIDQNHHLPEIPSEQEVIKDGINLGEMNKVLTKKVEELTLYLIEKDKELNVQQDQVIKEQSELKNQNGEIDSLKLQLKQQADLINKIEKKLENYHP